MTRYASKQTEMRFSKELKYLLYIPKGYDSDHGRRWPLIVFLHGAGERGDDLELVKMHGPPRLIDAGKKLPFIVVSPQLALGEWWSPDMVAWLAKDMLRTLRVDPDRVYLTGLSMGGYGTWETAAKYPELFAAIAPICGRGDPSIAWKLRHIPTWLFHGAKDPVVPLKHSDDMNRALKQYGNVKYTIYPNAEHDSWTETYSNEELYRWFLSHVRFKYANAPMPVEPDGFVGKYASKENSAEVYLKEGGLYIALETSGNKVLPLNPCGVDSFTFGDFGTYEIKFVSNGRGSYDAAIVYERQMTLLKKTRSKTVKSSSHILD
jgi:pimeloyl-ACP methyl ester carboxylesterase